MVPAAVVACQIVSARFRAGPSGLVVVSSDSAVGELGITTGGTSKLVDRIEASGYCRRLPNPQDRRSSLLELTPEGRRLFGEAAEAFDDELRRRLSTAVPERTLRQFAATLARLRAASHRAGMEKSA